MVTKSGTNDIHGDVFEFVRNGDLNARNFFAPTQDTLKRNQYGGAVGGPILKNRLFYFGTYQGTKIRSAAQGNVAFVPTAAERSGDFSGSGMTVKDPVTGMPFRATRFRQICSAHPRSTSSITLRCRTDRMGSSLSGREHRAERRPISDQDELARRQEPTQRKLVLDALHRAAGRDDRHAEHHRG